MKVGPASSSNGSKLQYNTTQLPWQRLKFPREKCFFSMVFSSLSRVSASLPVDGAAFSAVPCQKWTHSRVDLLSSTPGEAHRGCGTRRALAVLTEASCVRGISLDRVSPASAACGARKGLVSCDGTRMLQFTCKLEEPPFLLHHLADSLGRLDADWHRRRDVSLTFPGVKGTTSTLPVSIHFFFY